MASRNAKHQFRDMLRHGDHAISRTMERVEALESILFA